MGETSAPVTEKPKKCYCICQWKQCKKTDGSPEGQRACFAKLRECIQNRKCRTEVCDTPLDACMEKATEKQKKRLMCERAWKQCYVAHRKEICSKKGDLQHYDEPPPPEPSTEEPPPPETEEPPTTEEPVTSAPVTEKPKKCYCICQWKQCKKTDGSPEGQRACFAKLRECIQNRKCRTEVCDTPLDACMEKATEKQKERLMCERAWKQCYVAHRKEICSKKGDLQHFDEPPPPEPSTEEPPPPETEEPPTTEEPVTSAPVTEKPKKCYCICQWKQCKKTDGSPEGQ